jgi:leader peptidase (prepilin peptidase) / N-methyltransferase
MTAVRILIALPLGLAVGSFMTVAVWRIPRKESLVAPRSRCPSCGVEIGNRDNIPVVSWLLLRGRCRNCGEPISPFYPLLELATASMFVGAALRFDDVWLAVIFALFLGMLPAIALIDLRHRIIPNRLLYPALLATPVLLVAARLFGAEVDLVRAALGLVIYGGGTFLIALVSGGMGMGDVKLNGLSGLVLGAVGLRLVAVAAGASILLGGIGAIVALARGASRKSAIPFGPFLVAGSIVAAFWGERLAEWYLGVGR